MGQVKRLAKSVRPLASFPSMLTATLAVPSGTLVLWSDQIGNAKTDELYPIAGVTGSVDTSGAVRQRLSGSRVALTGGLGLFFPKKVDDRLTYVSVEGPAFFWTFALPAKSGAERFARAFLAQIETQARKAAVEREPVPVAVAAPQPPAGWFPDAQNPALVRWWDGEQWTDHTQPRQ